MIDRILFHVYSNDLLSDNQYGFTPQRGTADAAMEVKNFIEESLRLKQCAVIDSKFNFNAHIDHTVAKLITLVNMLARTAKLQWGLGHKALKTIYEGAVVPLLTYGAPIWIEAIWKNKNLTKYKRIQRLMNIKIAKAYRTISYDASCVIAGVRPI